MHIGDAPDEAAFRAEARAWLTAHASPRPGRTRARDRSGRHQDLAEHVRACRQWQHTLAEHGWAGITWPAAFGGRGGTPIQAAIFNEEQAAFDVATGAFAVAIGMVGPTLMSHGTPEQQQRFLGPMLRGDHVWCQLFSEPGAGSDLASLSTRAELDGDAWVVNGQKVWTSLGQFADFGIILARTDPDVPKHRGITFFVVDMRDPGIEVRPLTQITGVAHFNETFLTDVRIPVDDVVGAVGDGWNVARTTLTSERSFIGAGGGAWSVAELVELAGERGVADDPVFRQELMRAHSRAAVLTYLGYRLRTAMSQGRLPGPEALVMKLAYARHWAATTATAMRVLGADAELAGEWQQHFLGQYAVRLGGGTDEVQQNLIGELGLGLPREPAVDRDVAWKDLQRV
jgi:alkylation response protein AidB-like acyl-CoA dehydrogenase